MKAPFAICLVAAGVAAAAAVAAEVAGLRINWTASQPPGIYRAAAGSPGRGDLVEACPPATPATAEALARGYYPRGWRCAAGTAPILKEIVAVAGDMVAASADGVYVNGRMVPCSRPAPADSAGRPLVAAVAEGRVQQGEMWVMSTASSASYDSRYFGAIHAGAVRRRMVPIWTVDSSMSARATSTSTRRSPCGGAQARHLRDAISSYGEPPDPVRQ